MTKEQWKQVLDELKKCPLFCGHYDAKNGDRNYIYGIATVMEFVAMKAEDNSFEDMFYENMMKSEEVKDERFD